LEQAAEKGAWLCHSERSEKSLFEKGQQKERFLGASLLGMTHKVSFSAAWEE
jgi:hypothetical protein